ncbi:MAG: lipid-binding SYLF domain-containing protein [Cyanobacteria bacterium P01_A01_bin.135]
MLKSGLTIAVSLTLAAGVALPSAADELEDAIDELTESQTVFEEIAADPDTRIPPELLQRSEAVIIITNLGQGGFIVGGRSGDGVMLVRQVNGAWSNPAFLSLGGGSIGLQFGGRSSDLVMLVQNNETVADIINGGAEFGADLSGTAGPVSGSAANPAESDDDILVYSRSSGLFGGVAFDGSTFSFDEDRNEVFYNQVNVTPEQILLGDTLTPGASSAALERALLDAQ